MSLTHESRQAGLMEETPTNQVTLCVHPDLTESLSKLILTQTQIVSSNTSRESTKSAAKMDTWTGVLPSTPGPSAQTLPGEYPSDSLRDEAELFHDVEAVSERFKYLICSSGLLEKDWVAGFGGTSTSFGGLDLEDEPVDPIASRAVKPLAETKQSGLWVDVLGWATKGKERWDMVIAGVVLSIAISILLGPAGMHAKYNIILGLIGVTVLSSLSCIQWVSDVASFWPSC